MSKEEKKDSPAVAAPFDVEALVRAVVSQVLPAAVQIAVQASAQKQTPAPVDTSHLANGRCEECGQPVIRGKFACDKKHRKLSVFPNFSPEYFPGLGLNGHWYKSNYLGHEITIPADFNAEEMIQRWDKQEMEAKIGKKRNASQYERDFRHQTNNL